MASMLKARIRGRPDRGAESGASWTMVVVGALVTVAAALASPAVAEPAGRGITARDLAHAAILRQHCDRTVATNESELMLCRPMMRHGNVTNYECVPLANGGVVPAGYSILQRR